MHFFGSHPNDDGGIHMAVQRAAAAGMQALQIFSAKPQFYNEKIAVKPERIERFQASLQQTGIDPQRCIVHAGYVLNLASPEMDKYERSALALEKELLRTQSLGVFGCCFHPGSAGTSDPYAAAERVGEAMAVAASRVPGTARILIENTAGGGRTMGRTAEEIRAMLAPIPAELRGRVGYGLDTCHLFASGLDFTSSRDAVTRLLDQFCEVIGEPPSFFHLNDSEGDFASNRDRHALIGEGRIGIEPFRWLLADSRTEGIPLVLETPHERSEVAEDDASPDPYDVRMMKLLGELVRG